jgi:hypothetical protein
MVKSKYARKMIIKLKIDIVWNSSCGFQRVALWESDAALLPGKLQIKDLSIQDPRVVVHRHFDSPFRIAMFPSSCYLRRKCKPYIIFLYNPFDLQSISYRLRTPKRWELFLPTSKNLFSHQTWKIPSPTKTPI